MSEITKDQLELLMKSHKESVELNTTLLGKLDLVIDSQKNSCNAIDKLCGRIDHQTETLITSNLQMGQTLVSMRTSSLKEHNSIINKIYVAFTMMGTIILGIISSFFVK